MTQWDSSGYSPSWVMTQWESSGCSLSKLQQGYDAVGYAQGVVSAEL